MVVSNNIHGDNQDFYTYDGHSWRNDQISTIPEKTAMCYLVKINDYEMMVIGGYSLKYLAQNSTYLYAASTIDWTQRSTLLSTK